MRRRIVTTGSRLGTTGAPLRTTGRRTSAPDRCQGLEPLAIAAAEVHLGTILETDAPVAADPGRHFGDPADIHEVGFMHAHEPFRVELALELGERGTDFVGLATDMEDGVV